MLILKLTYNEIIISLNQIKGYFSYEGIFNLYQIKDLNNVFNFFNSLSSIKKSIESTIEKINMN